MNKLPSLATLQTFDLRFAAKRLIAFLLSAVALGWAVTVDARTTRSCNAEIFLYDVEYRRDDGRWSRAYFRSGGPTLNAGNLVFQASAPGASHNLARKRASQKAERCINRWWHGEYCTAAHSTSYGNRHGRVGIRPLMEEAICADLRNKGRPDLLGRQLRGELYGKINGDRCCFDSNRRCPYNYGVQRAGRLSTGGPGGRQLWPGVTHYVNCGR